jgi:hypothetical protein
MASPFPIKVGDPICDPTSHLLLLHLDRIRCFIPPLLPQFKLRQVKPYL